MSNNLGKTQKMFLGALQKPSGEFYKEYSETENLDVKKLIKSDSDFTASDRFEIYHRQYWYRIIDSLSEDFIMLNNYVGEKVFLQLAENYLLEYPPESFSLRHLGKDFPIWLATKKAGKILKRNVDQSEATYFAQVDYAEMITFEAPQQELLVTNDLESAKIKLQDHVQLVVPYNYNNKGLSDNNNLCTNKFYVVWRDLENNIIKDQEAIGYLDLLNSLKVGGSIFEIIDRLNDLPEANELKECFTRWQERNWFALV